MDIPEKVYSVSKEENKKNLISKKTNHNQDIFASRHQAAEKKTAEKLKNPFLIIKNGLLFYRLV